MARRLDRHYERPVPSELLSPYSQRPSDDMPDVDEDETSVDIDEPPEHQKSSNRTSLVSKGRRSPNSDYQKLPAIPTSAMGRRESLLTQALMTSPDQPTFPKVDLHLVGRALSNASMYSNTSNATSAELTSDGGLTSPARTNTPSPPPPFTNTIGLPLFPLDDLGKGEALKPHQQLSHATPAIASTVMASDKNSEDCVGRTRRITFACGATGTQQVAKSPTKTVNVEQPAAVKRPCALRFACAPRPDKDVYTDVDGTRKAAPRPSPPFRLLSQTRPGAISLLHRDSQDSQLTIKENTAIKSSTPPRPANVSVSPKPKSKSSKYRVEDEAWITETPRARPKITVSDTLRKENIIRRIGEEAEEEALLEEDAENEAELDGDTGDSDEDEENLDTDEEASDGGNESDDEHGFADSDDEDEVDSECQFWAPGASTAATSADHFDHIRPTARRIASESSIESTLKTDPVNTDMTSPSRRSRETQRHRKAKKIRSSTPELPDSTDFVCGTLDEDRPLEVAYIQYLEQHKLATRGIRPQDVDPSFPTSDLDEDDDDDVAAGSDEENAWVTGRPDDSDEGIRRGRMEGVSRKPKKSPAPSPRRLRSPPPKRQGSHRSPPPANKYAPNNSSPTPRQLFGHHSPRRMRSPAMRARDIKSPPSSPRALLAGPTGQPATPIDMPLLAQRPNLTHTKSLPRTPNPYFTRRNIEALAAARQDSSVDTHDTPTHEQHSRGPIDIVQGLERKRQRTREKFLRQHCRNGAKEKDRRIQPGKGAQRMRELGMEMADRNRAYGPRAELILSI